MAFTRCINQPRGTNYLTYTEVISNSSITINYETEQLTVNQLSRKLPKAQIIVIKGNNNRVNVGPKSYWFGAIGFQVDKVPLTSTYEPAVDEDTPSRLVVLKGEGNHYRIRKSNDNYPDDDDDGEDRRGRIY